MRVEWEWGMQRADGGMKRTFPFYLPHSAIRSTQSARRCAKKLVRPNRPALHYKTAPDLLPTYPYETLLDPESITNARPAAARISRRSGGPDMRRTLARRRGGSVARDRRPSAHELSRKNGPR